jgi:type II restriction/modification system DNA methylase subunit YeeA
VNTLIPHTRTNVQNLVQFIGIVREKYQNKLTVLDAKEIASDLFPSGRQPLAPTNQLTGMDNVDAQGALSFEAGGDDNSAGTIQSLVTLFKDAKTFGSLITIPDSLMSKLPALLGLLGEQTDGMFSGKAVEEIKPLLTQGLLLSQKYDCVVANPPYMGGKGMNSQLSKWAKDNYPDSKSDLFAIFIERNLDYVHKNGLVGMITMQSWMFLSSFEKLRKRLFSQETILSMAHLGARAFDSIGGEVVSTTAFVLSNSKKTEYKGGYLRLVDGKSETEKKAAILEAVKDPDCGWIYSTTAAEFKKIPSSPLAYWVSTKVIDVFNHATSLSQIADIGKGLDTGDNNRFLRLWFEVPQITEKWVPCQKGGPYRKWYGNNDFVINWANEGEELKKFSGSNLRNSHNYLRSGLSWTRVSSGSTAFRFFPEGSIFESTGPCVFTEKNLLYVIVGFLNSNLTLAFLKFMAPTLDFQSGHISALPVINIKSNELAISEIAKKCIKFSKLDWDSYETSWDFQSFPMLSDGLKQSSVALSYTNWEKQCQVNIQTMKSLEEENSRLFIEAYGLQDELTPKVPEDQITLARADQTEDIKRLISYSIGCMMGRYSLDHPGLIYAHSGNEGFDHSKYPTFPADDDGIVPVTDRDWFPDDSTNRFVEFIGKAWPNEHLEENLKFIADSLKMKSGEAPNDTIRRYLSTGFYKDHMKTYKKRPIYWLFSSGKQKAFECLVYLHRYNEATLSRMRMEYVTPLQGRISSRIDQLTGDVESATSTANSKKLNKERDKLLKQQSELSAFDDKLRHLADKRISLDLDDGVKVNYGKFDDLLAEVKAITGKKK